MLFSAIVLLEILFSFFSISCSGGNTLVAKNWFNHNWSENRLGFRDKNPEDINRHDKKNIFIVGDSYVAGHGINEENDRFSNILRSRLENCFDVFNIAKPGADTKKEFGFITSFPLKPDLLIVAHVNNDIYTVLDKNAISTILQIAPQNKSKFKKFKPSGNYLITHSFLLNFINYLLTEKKKDEDVFLMSRTFSSFNAFLNSEAGKTIEMAYYKNDSLLKLHLKDIDKFVNYATENNIDLLFILFPKMNDVVMDFTNTTANIPIAEYLENKKIGVINLTPVIRTIKQEERIVSKFDSHPGVTTHIAVADTIQKYLKTTRLFVKYCN